MNDARPLYLAGSLGALYYLVAQALQQVILAGPAPRPMPPPSGFRT